MSIQKGSVYRLSNDCHLRLGQTSNFLWDEPKSNLGQTLNLGRVKPIYWIRSVINFLPSQTSYFSWTWLTEFGSPRPQILIATFRLRIAGLRQTIVSIYWVPISGNYNLLIPTSFPEFSPTRPYGARERVGERTWERACDYTYFVNSRCRGLI